MELKDMTLKQKIGQMIIAGFPSREADDHIEKLIEEYNVGNVILFSRNIEKPKQLYDLNKELQKLALNSNGIPLFIAVDQEGGMVSRMPEGVASFPGNMALSAGGDENEAYLAGKYCGEELKALGINMNLAPVLDVNNNPYNPVIGVRSFGEVPQKVAKYGCAYIKGLQENNIIAVGKHFPGHGDTSVDSHLDLSSVNHDKERLKNVELYPFNEAVKSGLKAIMSAHVIFPAYEEKSLPGTLSRNVLTGLLKEELGFKGLILTDCMEMKAIDKYFTTEKAAVMAVKAGANLICISHTLEKQIRSINNIIEAVKNGEISEEAIDKSVDKIIRYKEKLEASEFVKSSFENIKNQLNKREHVDFANRVSERSITIFKGKNYFPINGDNVLFISTDALAVNGADDLIENRSINSSFKKAFPKTTTEIISIKPNEDVIKSLVKSSLNMEKVIICTYNAGLNKEQVYLVKEILKVNKNVMVIAMRNPYDIKEFTEVPCYVATYEYTPLAIKSVIKLLKGQISGEGKAPVKLD